MCEQVIFFTAWPGLYWNRLFMNWKYQMQNLLLPQVFTLRLFRLQAAGSYLAEFKREKSSQFEWCPSFFTLISYWNPCITNVPLIVLTEFYLRYSEIVVNSTIKWQAIMCLIERQNHDNCLRLMHVTIPYNKIYVKSKLYFHILVTRGKHKNLLHGFNCPMCHF